MQAHFDEHIAQRFNLYNIDSGPNSEHVAARARGCEDQPLPGEARCLRIGDVVGRNCKRELIRVHCLQRAAHDRTQRRHDYASSETFPGA